MPRTEPALRAPAPHHAPRIHPSEFHDGRQVGDLRRCDVCEGPLSSRARACPHCGEPGADAPSPQAAAPARRPAGAWRRVALYAFWLWTLLLSGAAALSFAGAGVPAESAGLGPEATGLAAGAVAELWWRGAVVLGLAVLMTRPAD